MFGRRFACLGGGFPDADEAEMGVLAGLIRLTEHGTGCRWRIVDFGLF